MFLLSAFSVSCVLVVLLRRVAKRALAWASAHWVHWDESEKAARDRIRLLEDGSSVPFYAILTLYDLLYLPRRPWFLAWYSCGIASHDALLTDPLTLAYYCFALAFYLHALVSLLLWDARRKDFLVMLLHHCVTVALILLSLLNGNWMVGTNVLFCHNLVDTVLYTTTSLRYVAKNKAHKHLMWLPYLGFGLFVVSYAALRLGVFYSVVAGCRGLLSPAAGTPLLSILLPADVFPAIQWSDKASLASVVGLHVLYAMHVYWFGLILSILWGLLRGDKVKE